MWDKFSLVARYKYINPIVLVVGSSEEFISSTKQSWFILGTNSQTVRETKHGTSSSSGTFRIPSPRGFAQSSPTIVTPQWGTYWWLQDSYTKGFWWYLLWVVIGASSYQVDEGRGRAPRAWTKARASTICLRLTENCFLFWVWKGSASLHLFKKGNQIPLGMD